MTFTEREVRLMSKLAEAAVKLIDTDDAVITVEAEGKRYVAQDDYSGNLHISVTVL